MKNFEDRAWEDMLQRLDNSLPNHKPKSKLYWAPVAIAILGFVLGGYILLDNFILNQDPSGILVQKNESSLPSIKQQGNLDVIATIKEVAPIGGDNSLESSDNKDLAQFDAESVSKSTQQESPIRGKQQLIHPESTFITKAEGNDQVNSKVSAPLDDENNENSINVRTSEYGAKTVVAVHSTFKSRDAGELAFLESKDIKTVDFPESQLKTFEGLAFDKKELGRNWNFSIALGSFANAAFKYSGINAIPAVSYLLNKKSALSVRIPVWVRHTRDDKIVEDVNQKLNASFDSQKLFVPDAIDIVSQKVNTVTVDAGVALGYSHRINQKISLATSGIARYENISGLIQASSSIQNFSRNTNHAYESIEKMYAAKNDGWSYGANVELDYRFSPRHSMYGTVAYMSNKKSSVEIGIGYSYRIY